jgi:hypothetical protein
MTITTVIFTPCFNGPDYVADPNSSVTLIVATLAFTAIDFPISKWISQAATLWAGNELARAETHVALPLSAVNFFLARTVTSPTWNHSLSPLVASLHQLWHQSYAWASATDRAPGDVREPAGLRLGWLLLLHLPSRHSGRPPDRCRILPGKPAVRVCPERSGGTRRPQAAAPLTAGFRGDRIARRGQTARPFWADAATGVRNGGDRRPAGAGKRRCGGGPRRASSTLSLDPPRNGGGQWGVSTRKVPFELGRWELLKLPRSGPKGHLASAIVTRAGEDPRNL